MAMSDEERNSWLVGMGLPPNRRVTASDTPAAPKPVAAATPVAAAPKPLSFAARLRAMMDTPEARQRPRQALALAAETSCSPAEARRVLAGLPTDEARDFQHGGSLFGTAPKLDAEAARMVAILQAPEAEGREQAALAYALDTHLSLDQARALLRAQPIIAAERIPTIEERAAGMEEFGVSEMPRAGKGQSKVDDMWRDTIASLNAKTEATLKQEKAK